jgi:WS/DGAT/MGAT family acyltransferase
MSEEIRFPHRLGNQDALMWSVESDPVLRSTAAAVSLLDRAPNRERLTEKLERATRSVPRLRQRVVTPAVGLGRPSWSEDPNFDLDYHLRWVRAPRDGSLRPLLDLAAAIAMQGFDRTRPLWEFTVVEGLAGGGAAIIQKLHHCVTDGAGGILLMQRVYDIEREAPLPSESPATPADDAGDPGWSGSLRSGGGALLRGLVAAPGAATRGAARVLDAATHPLRTARGAADDVASLAHLLTPALSPLSPIMRRRSTNYRFATLRVPLASLKAAAHGADCKLNDAFLAALAGGWRRYHERHGAEVKALRVSMPIDLRGAGGDRVAGNRMMLARFPVPLAERDPARRMRAIRDLVATERAQSALLYVDAAAGVLRHLPDALLAQVFGAVARGVDFVGACVPGLPIPLYTAGARVETLYTFGPPAGTAANLTLFSYLGQALVAINADPAAVPDPDVLCESMREGFDEVLKLG